MGVSSAGGSTDWNGIALKMIPVLILVLMGFMYYFNHNLDKFDVALNETDSYFVNNNITRNPFLYDNFATDGERVFYPHHIILVLVIIGVFVVIAFAVFILNNIDQEPKFEDRYGD